MRILRALPDGPEGGWLASGRGRRFCMEMLVALCLAFLVWLYARSRSQEALDMVAIPVQVYLAPGTEDKYDLEIHRSNRVIASFTGPPSAIREVRSLLQRGAVCASVTLAVPEERQKDNAYREAVEIQPAAIAVPPGVTVVLTEGRNRIHATLHRLAERQLPVRLEYAGEPRISQVKIEPATVLVRGPKATLDRIRSVPTQPFSPPATTANEPNADGLLRSQVALVSELDGRPVVVCPNTVAVRYRLHAKQKVYELVDVPVHFLCPPGFAWAPRFRPDQPAKVNVKIVGPALDEPPSVQAFVDLTRGTCTRGRNVEPLRLQLPRDFQLAQDAPQRVAFWLDPIEKAE